MNQDEKKSLPSHPSTPRPQVGSAEAATRAFPRRFSQPEACAEDQLTEVRSRIRRSSQIRAFAPPAPQAIRHLALTATIAISTGLLAASLLHIVRRPSGATKQAEGDRIEAQVSPPSAATRDLSRSVTFPPSHP